MRSMVFLRGGHSKVGGGHSDAPPPLAPPDFRPSQISAPPHFFTSISPTHTLKNIVVLGGGAYVWVGGHVPPHSAPPLKNVPPTHTKKHSGFRWGGICLSGGGMCPPTLPPHSKTCPPPPCFPHLKTPWWGLGYQKISHTEKVLRQRKFLIKKFVQDIPLIFKIIGEDGVNAVK